MTVDDPHPPEDEVEQLKAALREITDWYRSGTQAPGGIGAREALAGIGAIVRPLREIIEYRG